MRINNRNEVSSGKHGSMSSTHNAGGSTTGSGKGVFFPPLDVPCESIPLQTFVIRILNDELVSE
jgi:hypothetical protein